MKGLVYIWSQINLIPMLAPLVLFPLLWILRRFFETSLENINAAFVTLIIFGAVVGGTYWTFTESPHEYLAFLTRRGVETDAKVLSVTHGDSPLMGGAYDEVEFVYQDSEGTPLKESYVSIPRRFFPLIHEPIVPPSVGDQLRILYFPTVESGFIVLTNALKSRYGAKLECNEAQLALSKSELRYRHDDFPTREDTQALRSAIENLLPLDCIDLKERDRLRTVKDNLKK